MLIGSSLSKPTCLNVGVPQGLTLGPVLFNMFLTTFCYLLVENESMYQVYADDTFLFLECNLDNQPTHDKMERLLDVLFNWFASAGLKLHPDKTELVLSKTVKSTVSWKRVKLLNETVDIKAKLKSIGVFLDNSLNYRKHIAAVTSSCFFQLRKLNSIRRFLDFESRHMLIRTCVLSKLYHSYSFLAGVCAKDLQKLQRVQKCSCRFIYGLHHSSSTFFHMHDLNWLTIKQRVKFKLLCFLYKALFNA